MLEDNCSTVMPECFRLTRRFAAEVRWAYRASSLTIGKNIVLEYWIPARSARE